MDPKDPVAGRADGRIHASAVTVLAGLSGAVLFTATESFVRSNVAARSAVSAVRLDVPRVTPFRKVPTLAPAVSAAVVPDVSPRRQHPTGASAVTAAL